MLKRSLVRLLMLVLLGPVAVALAQAPAEKKPKDRQEYDLFMGVTKETDPNKKLGLLDQWKQKYPESDYKVERQQFFVQTYQQAGQPAKAVDAARELLTLAPKDFLANFTITSLCPFLGSNDEKLLSDCEKAANTLPNAERPPNVDDAAWGNAQKAANFLVPQALGWIAWQRKNFEEAERHFLKALEVSPAAAQVSYWLGTVVLAQKNPDKNTLALYSFARAAAFDGQGALTPQGRQQIDAYLTKIYTSYHGSTDGLDKLKQLAKTQPLPPPDLKIKSSEEVKAEKEEALRRDNPLLAQFLVIKENLTGPDGANFWSQMKGTLMPQLRGKVISAKPAVRPKVVEIAISQGTEPEIQLATPETGPRCQLEPGAEITFESAEAVDFTPSPFLIKMQNGKITSGCKEAPPARPAGKKTKKG